MVSLCDMPLVVRLTFVCLTSGSIYQRPVLRCAGKRQQQSFIRGIYMNQDGANIEKCIHMCIYIYICIQACIHTCIHRYIHVYEDMRQHNDGFNRNVV